jgi:hypothetical protein
MKRTNLAFFLGLAVLAVIPTAMLFVKPATTFAAQESTAEASKARRAAAVGPAIDKLIEERTLDSSTMEERIKLAKEIVELSQVGKSLISTMEIALKDVPPSMKTEVIAKLSKGLPELLDLSAEIQAKHIDLEALKAMLAFYKTPEGRRLTAALPAITAESAEAGRKWGERLMSR